MKSDNIAIKELNQWLTQIEIALASTHNTITTDVMWEKADETHWKIDNSKELQIIESLRKILTPTSN